MGLQKELYMLDAKLFKAFMVAAEAENFTNAAKSIFMTQSGMSQHVAKLEEQVGVPLFKRIGKRVVLTDAGKKLQSFIKQHTHFTEIFLDDLREKQETMDGLVSYAMPASCLLAPHFPLMLQKRKQYPGIQMDVTVAPSRDVVNMVLDNKVEFGFVKSKNNHPSLNSELFCQEEYVLVGACRDQLASITAKNIMRQPCVVYPGSDICFERWLQHHFSGKVGSELLNLSSHGYSSTIDGAIKMVEGGMGISVFPRHCVAEQLEEGDLFEYASGKEPLLNDVYLITLAEHSYPRVVRQVVRWFLDMRNSSVPVSMASRYQRRVSDKATAEFMTGSEPIR